MELIVCSASRGPTPMRPRRSMMGANITRSMRELLDAMQQGLAFRTVPLNRLLFEEFVEIGIATVGI